MRSDDTFYMQLNSDIFRAYDIRGKFPGEINEKVADIVIAKLVRHFKPKTAIIARDARLSSPRLYSAVRTRLEKEGVHIIELGLITTPAFYYCANISRADFGVMITASHNPKNYNGLKPVLRGALRLSGKEVFKIIGKSR